MHDSYLLQIKKIRRLQICGNLSNLVDFKDIPGIVILIFSQENVYHKEAAEQLKYNIIKQGESLEVLTYVHILPDDTSHLGYWTLIPELPRFVGLYARHAAWMFVCDESTVVNLKQLLNVLNDKNKNEKMWMGFGLNDEEPSIIHHFAFAENPSVFKYPLISAGFVMSMALLKDVLNKQHRESEKDTDFSIDASYELALFIGEDRPLINEPSLFCEKPGDNCISYHKKIKLCRPPINEDEIFIAVKTCQKFHQNRVPFVQKTWGRFAKHIKFFSDTANKTIPTTHVGVKNTERGHCLKTMRILKLALNEVIKKLHHVKWVVLVDDDTILSVERLQSLLACYNVDTVVGERYGYKVRRGRGYNYLTGGGGIAFGIGVLHDIVDSCHCPEIDSPDDMILGMCITSLNILITHSPLFHQARPMDYARGYLDIGLPVSFHKHWNLDPLLVYQKWFNTPDYEPLHTEL